MDKAEGKEFIGLLIGEETETPPPDPELPPPLPPPLPVLLLLPPVTATAAAAAVSSRPAEIAKDLVGPFCESPDIASPIAVPPLPSAVPRGTGGGAVRLLLLLFSDGCCR